MFVESSALLLGRRRCTGKAVVVEAVPQHMAQGGEVAMSVGHLAAVEVGGYGSGSGYMSGNGRGNHPRIIAKYHQVTFIPNKKEKPSFIWLRHPIIVFTSPGILDENCNCFTATFAHLNCST